MFVKDYMLKNVCTISDNDTLEKAIEIMVEKKTNGLVVIDKNNEIVGTLSSFAIAKSIVPDFLKDDPNSSIYETEGIFDKYVKESSGAKVSEVMYKDVHVLTHDDAMIEAASFSAHADHRMMPVVKKGTNEIVGIVTRTSIKNACFNALKKKSW